jgi:ubiquinone/menaquinone biosynthesis C-methylase UbiE
MGLQYLHEGPVTVVDIGCGFSDFALQVQQKNPMAVTYCLDGNPETVEALRIQGYNAQIYHALERLPFKNNHIEFIHCSHLIEHLQPQELYVLLQEINRILTVQGVLIISAPTLWENFYDDLSHVRPYPPSVLDKYLRADVSEVSNTRKHIRAFRREALFYRYEKHPIFSALGLRGDPWFLDLIVLGVKKALTRMGIYRLTTTGYTAVYRKVQ